MYRRVVHKLYFKEYMKSRIGGLLNVMLYHSVEEPHGAVLPAEWYEKAYPKMVKLSRLLKGLDEVDGRLMNIKDESIVVDDLTVCKMNAFKSLVRAFIGSPSIQQKLKRSSMASSVVSSSASSVCFSQLSENQPVIINSLTQVSDLLRLSAQQRKLVKQKISPQVTQQKIWTGAIMEILNGLKYDLDYFNRQCSNRATSLGQQIVSSCVKFLDKTVISSDPDSPSWMKLGPTKSLEAPNLYKWEDVLEMFNDLIKCLGEEKGLLLHVRKLNEMKEGLYQIKDVSVDRNIGYRDSRHQEILLQKKLSKALGHSSPCLFTLLFYYLYGRVGSTGVDLCGGILGPTDGSSVCLHMGKILTSEEAANLWSGVKQLDKMLGLFKFVWETAGMKGSLELQGHLWCVGAEDKTLTYRGNTYILHGIRH
ncbi:uncharacterized protein LOC116205915 isoform X1 [Punica granatum]|uniref:Uncharacterized protein LOC116205915 isoform X1 n=2 Tax=Punica granatum TaxID=22663 RepID=A0A6P8DM65_PUNGR|nr:uncharacterized protein LOC116205915 isoform X1 [Punica granatum]XP_031394472.1 uncharacterized protein LOC116205915 isoform X1 [Punica granatum]